MKKRLIALIIIVLLYIGIVIMTDYHYQYMVTYTNGKYNYELKVNEPFVTIKKYRFYRAQIECLEEPCETQHGKLRMIYTIPITKHLRKIIKENRKKFVEYEILDSNEYSGVKSRGYVFDEETNEVSIYTGEHNTGGYSLLVDNVVIKEDKIAYIDIKESVPMTGEPVTEAFTQPMIKIRIKAKVKDVIVNNYSKLDEEIKKQ